MACHYGIMAKNNIFLLIQGHTTYCEQMLEKVSGLDNVIWSTDQDSPPEHLEKITKSNVKLIVNPPVHFSGYGNVNLQTTSTYSGLLLAKELGATHVIKTRSDLIFTDPKKFISDYPFDYRLHHLAYIQHVPGKGNLLAHYPDLPQWINQTYPQFVEDTADFNYIADFSNLGPIDKMIDFWSYPMEHDHLRIPAEHKFLLRYCHKHYEKMSFSFEWYSSIFGWYIDYCQTTNNPMISFKRGWVTDELMKCPHVVWRGTGNTLSPYQHYF